MGPKLDKVCRQRGVTLIELLVVVSILAFMATVAVINAPPSRSDAQAEAERFAARARAASEYAVIHGAPTAVEISDGGYRVLQYGRGQWRDAGDGRLAAREFRGGVAVSVVVDDASYANQTPAQRSASDAPKRVVFDPLGVAAPFSAEFADRRGRWRVNYKADGMFEVIENGAG